MTETMAQTKSDNTGVRKGFVEAGGGLLHYVRRGQGPAVVMLHASPCSAKVMAPIQAAWSGEFTTFAFDLPGFGMSDLPQADDITIELLADVIAEGMDKLGIRQAALYGRHTGASVCLALALQRPDLVSMMLTDGLPVFATPYSEDRLKKYLKPITPSGDGMHLPWTFFRYRDQHMFWPWDAADIDHRSDADLPDEHFLHRGTVEMLEAAETYVPVYKSAFLYDTLSRIGGVSCPAYYGNRPGDSQFKTIQHYPEAADIRVMPRDPVEAEQAELELIRKHPAEGAVPDWTSRIGTGGDKRDYIATRHGVVYAIGANLGGGGLPQLLLPDMPGSIDLHQAEIIAASETRPVIAVDPGGVGNSDIDGVATVDRWCEQIDDVLNHLGWDRVEVIANGLSGALAAEFAERAGDRVDSLLLRSPALLNEEELAGFIANPAPEATPRADGGHLLPVWHHLRDQELWWPWFDTSHEAIRTNPPRISAAALNKRAVAMLKQAHQYRPVWAELISRDVAAQIAALPQPVRIETEPSDIFHIPAARYLTAAAS